VTFNQPEFDIQPYVSVWLIQESRLDVKELEGVVVTESEMCLFHRDGMCAITGSPSLVPMQAFHMHSDQHRFEGESPGN